MWKQLALPVERGANAIAGGDEMGGISRAAGGELDLEIDDGDALHGLDHLEYGKATVIAAKRRNEPELRRWI